MANFKEWDCTEQDYGRSISVREHISTDTDPDALRDFEDRFGSLSGIITREMGKQSKRSHLDRRTRRGGRVNPMYVGSELSLIAAGQEPTQRVFDRKVSPDRDSMKTNLALGFLIDRSGSTSYGVGNGMDRSDLMKYSALMIGRTLENMGDTYFVYSFDSCGNSCRCSHVYQHKDSEEPWSRNVEEKIASIQPGDANRDGAAIRFCNDKLIESANVNKLLFIISDGNPYCYGYKGHYAIDDLKRSMEEGQEKGIGYVYLTINPDSDADDTIHAIRRQCAYAKRFTNMRDIVTGLTDVYAKIKRGRI